jgi:hypothetical protein
MRGCIVRSGRPGRGERARLSAFVLTLFVIGGCQGDQPLTSPSPAPQVCAVRAVNVSPTSVALRVGGAQELFAAVDAVSCGAVAVTWRSQNEAIARVSPAGTVSAIAVGSATITATLNGVSGAAVVVVSPPLVPVATVALAPAALALNTGQTATVTATLRDAAGGVLTGRTVVWSTDRPSVATVSTAGVVTAQAVGSASITATSEGRSSSAPVTVTALPQNVQVTIENQLIYPINIDINGTVTGSIPAQSTRMVTVTASSSLELGWTLMPPVIGGRAIGDPMSGSFDLSNQRTPVSLTIDNVVGTTRYFAPIITNRTGVPLLMAVNWGLQSENRCNCTVPATGAATNIGYYRLFSNSNVSAFRSGGSYTGSRRFFFDFAPSVANGAGLLPLTFETAP